MQPRHLGCVKAARTSSPTSKCRGPIAGPIQARRSPGRDSSAPTVASRTPAASPRQPACAAPIADPSAAAKSTGMQSATWITQTRPGSRVTTASARGICALGSVSSLATPAPWTCSSQAGSPGRHSASRVRSRLRATASGSSPTCAPRLSESKGGALTPPLRQVKAARTRAGAGHSGSMSSQLSAPRSKRREQLRQIGRHRRLPGHGTPRSRMRELELRCVQSLTLERGELAGQGRARTRWPLAASAIEGVADQGMSDVRKMHAYLMSATRSRVRASHERVSPEPPLDAQVRDCGAAVGANGHASAGRSMPPDRLIHRAPTRHHSQADGQITALDLACGKRGNEPRCALRPSARPPEVRSYRDPGDARGRLAAPERGRDRIRAMRSEGYAPGFRRRDAPPGQRAC